MTHTDHIETMAAMQRAEGRSFDATDAAVFTDYARADLESARLSLDIAIRRSESAGIDTAAMIEARDSVTLALDTLDGAS